MIITTTIPYKSIYIFDDKVLLYRRGAFYLAEYDKIKLLVRCSLSPLKRIASKVRIINRLLRLEPRAVERLSQEKFVVCFAHKIWILDIDKKEMRVVFENRIGWSDTLNFCSDGKCIYWGEYGHNDERGEVKIYRMSQDERVNEAYSFPAGTVRHIHNIFLDQEKGGFWMLTGDNDAKSGIYRVSADWRTVTPIKTGKQRFRAVAGFSYNDGLIYATDSVTDINHIYLLSADGSLKDLAIINGSCIYGTETRTHYIFSTSVEPPEGGSIANMLSHKRGSGIMSRDVHIVTIRKKDLAVKIAAIYKKDWLPLKLFQYGSAMFPKGQTQSDRLWHYVMACKGVDGKSLLIDLD